MTPIPNPEDTVPIALESMRERLRKGHRPLTDDATIDEALTSAVHKILRALLMQFWDRTECTTAPFLTILREIDEPVGEALNTLESGAQGTILEAFEHEPNRPNAEGMALNSVKQATRVDVVPCLTLR